MLVFVAFTSLIMSSQPRELGDVRFGRDFDVAIAEARRADKPVLILFDEVPGCGTCTGYGDTVLSHPLVVEAAETLFVPVAIYNNTGGKDRAVLDSFGEPTWNNPVVRIVDADRRELAKRVNGDYSITGISSAMVSALEAAKKPVPEWLRLLALEYGAARTQIAVFGMYCFWSGEACYGAIDGVVATRTGFLDGEVVEVEYDPRRVSYEALAAQKCGRAVDKGDRLVRGSPKDDKYQLTGSPLRFVPMTRTQATKVNAMVGAGKDPSGLLSPRQLEILARAQRGDQSFADARGRTDLKALFSAVRRVGTGTGF